MKIGNKVRNARLLKGLKQEELAFKLNISQKQLSQIENNLIKTDIKTIEKIAEILELSVEQLLTFDEKQVFNNCNQSGNIQSTIHNHNDIETIKNLIEEQKVLYERLLQEQKEKYENLLKNNN